MVPALDEDIAHFADLPPSQSIAHLLPRTSEADARQTWLWRKSQTRTVKIMGFQDVHDCQRPLQHVHGDLKGHVLASSKRWALLLLLQVLHLSYI